MSIFFYLCFFRLNVCNSGYRITESQQVTTNKLTQGSQCLAEVLDVLSLICNYFGIFQTKWKHKESSSCLILIID